MEDDEVTIESSEHLVDLEGVLEADRRLADADHQELEGLNPLERLRQLQAWDDLAKLRYTAPEDDWLLDLLVGPSTHSLYPTEQEREEAAERLVKRWNRSWRFYDEKLWNATGRIALDQNTSREEVRRQALHAGLFLALHDARQSQITRIGRDRVITRGSELVLLQKKDLKQLARGGLTDELIEKLSSPPAGLHVFPPYRLLSPIHAALAGISHEQIRPIELRTAKLYHWVRRRTFKKAEAWLLEESGLDALSGDSDWDTSSGSVDRESTEPAVEQLSLLDVLDRRQADPLAALIREEELAQLLDGATPKQREILDLLRESLATGRGLADAKKQVAAELGTSVNRIDVAFSRLRQRVRDPL